MSSDLTFVAKSGRTDWIGSTPEHWTIDRLKWSVQGVFNGIWGNEPDIINDIICVRVADFDRQNFIVNKNPPTLRSVTADERRNRLLQQGDLLIEKSGGGDNQLVGCVVHFNQTYNAVCSNFLARMPLIAEMHPRYWCYVHAALYSSRLNLLSIKQTTGIQNLDVESYLKELAPYPPPSEQRAIADYLDKEVARVNALIASKERLVRLLDEQRRARIIQIVRRGLDTGAPLRDSSVAWLGKIPKHWETRRNTFLFRERDQRNETELPLLEVSINQGVILRRFSDDKIEGTAADFNTYKVARKGDIVFNRMRMWQGAVGIAPVDGLTSPDYTVAEPVGSMTAEYANALFRTAIFSAECARHSNGIVWDRLRLYWEGFRDIWVPLPPPEEQRAIVEHIAMETEKIDKVCYAAKSTIALLKERRAALIAAVVTGQINVS